MSNIPSSNYNQTTQQPIAKPTGEWATGEPSKMNNRDWSGQVKPGLEHDPLTSTSTSHKALDSSISSGEARMDSDFGRQSGMGSHGYQSSTVPSTHSSTLGSSSSSGIGAGSALVGSSLPTSHTTSTNTTTTDHHKSGGLLNKIMHPHQSSASGSDIHSSTTSTTTTTDHHKSGGMLSNILHPHHSSSTASTDLHSSTTSTTTTDHHKSGGMLSNILHPHHSSASTSSDVSSSTTSDQHKSGGIMGGLFGHKTHHTGSSLGTTTSSSSHHKDTAPHVPVPVGAGMGSGLPGMVSSLLGTDMARGVAHNEGTLNQPPVVTNQPGTTGVFTQKKL